MLTKCWANTGKCRANSGQMQDIRQANAGQMSDKYRASDGQMTAKCQANARLFFFKTGQCGFLSTPSMKTEQLL